MKQEIKVPSLGESISEATIGEILIASGSFVKTDVEILELETDKVNQVLYSPGEGVLSLTVKRGDTVKIGQVIGSIESGVKGESKSVTQVAEAIKSPPLPSKEEVKPKGTSAGQPIRVTREIFLTELNTSTQPRSVPFIPAKEPKVSLNGRETRRPMSKIRKVIAKKLVEAQQTMAMLTTFNEVDLTQLIQLREKNKEEFMKKYGVKLGFMSFFVKATVSALEAFPDLNSYIDGDEIVHRGYYDIGVAVGTDKGVIVPIIRNCDQLTFPDIEKSIENYAKKARDGKLVASDLQGGGFTITNGGVYGSLLSTPLLLPPQCGILGMHKIEKRPVVINDQIVIRSTMYLALSYDHRLIDGKEAVSFLVHIKKILEEPSLDI